MFHLEPCLTSLQIRLVSEKKFNIFSRQKKFQDLQTFFSFWDWWHSFDSRIAVICDMKMKRLSLGFSSSLLVANKAHCIIDWWVIAHSVILFYMHAESFNLVHLTSLRSEIHVYNYNDVKAVVSLYLFTRINREKSILASWCAVFVSV